MSTLASVIIRDVIANLPAAGIPGRLFFASDTGAALRDNGTSWDAVTTSPGTLTTEDVTFSGTSGTLAHAPTALLGLYRNGSMMSVTSGAPAIQKYSITGAAVTLTTAAGTGDWFSAVYYH